MEPESSKEVGITYGPYRSSNSIVTQSQSPSLYPALSILSPHSNGMFALSQVPIKEE